MSFKIKILIITIFYFLTGCGLFVESVILKNNSCSYQKKESIDYWSHPEKTIEEQMLQWIACGGNSNGNYGTGDRNGSQYICMLNMGYRHNSWCNVANVSPICREMASDKFPPYQ